jgi:hypothetical protein
VPVTPATESCRRGPTGDRLARTASGEALANGFSFGLFFGLFFGLSSRCFGFHSDFHSPHGSIVMILWSKGLGKLVLRMSLADRSSISDRDEKLFIEGTMGAPTHWDYSVSMNEEDVLDFVDLLKQPAPVRFVVEADSTGLLLRTALMSGVLFAWNTARCFLGMLAAPPAQATAAVRPKAVAKAAEVSDNEAKTNRSE